jgi:hypothetical protein
MSCTRVLRRALPGLVAALVLGAGGASYGLAAPVDDAGSATSSTSPAGAGAAQDLLRGSYTATYDRLSVPSSAVTSLAPPRVQGEVAVGETVRATAGRWRPADVRLQYRWVVDGKAVRGATRPTYAVRPADLGRRLAVVVTARTAGRRPAVATSAAKRVRPGTLEQRRAPSLTGRPVVGGRLTVQPGAWAPGGVTVEVQWLRGTRPVAGATRTTYRVTRTDLGSRLRAVVTVSRRGYADRVVRTAATAPVTAR